MSSPADNSHTELLRRRKAKALAQGPCQILPLDKTTLQEKRFGGYPYIAMTATGPSQPSSCCPLQPQTCVTGNN